jgi:hypothetical protein
VKDRIKAALYNSLVRDRIKPAFLFSSLGQDIGTLLVLQSETGYRHPFGSSVRNRKKPAF